ncbi:MAG: hypothetical protein QOD40_572, partial [Alphaproteobacteria bacterium]|nr:hypothetical protein [Alphaproteobacteria bacterium]
LGVTFQQVQKYEKGTNRISMSRMVKIAAALGRPVAWFVDQDAAGKKHDNDKNDGDLVTRVLTSPYGVSLCRDYLAIAEAVDRHVVAKVAHALAGKPAAARLPKARAA